MTPGKESLVRFVSLWSTLLCVCCLYAEAPPISDPDMMAPPGSMPGIFPATVTAANINAAPIPGSIVDGAGSNTIKVSFPAAGPIKWTESRHNEGDTAILIGPFDPNDPSYFPPDMFVDDYKPLADGQPFANTTLAWRANRDTGALLATVRQNGVNNMDTANGVTPFGITNGIAYFNADFGQGWGYRMNDGVFANGGSNSADLQTGIAGFGSEGTFNTAVSYFPYEQGWLGAYVDAADSGVATFSSGSPDVDPSSVTWSNSVATVDLPNVDPMSDGMLFVAPTNGGNDTDIAAGFPTEAGWQVTIREDDDFDFTGQTINGGGSNGFQFLYMPYDTAGLIGGFVSGTDGSLINSAGDSRFSVTRTNTGEYALRILDAGGTEALTEDNGMLILSVASALPGSTTLGDRKFLSYEFDATSGDFIVQSRELVAVNSPQSQNANGDELALRDVNFYFTFVDFADPLGPAPSCDFDGSGACDIQDIDALVMEIAAGTNDPMFDLTGDGLVNTEDRDEWLSVAGQENLGPGLSYLIGDADLDGVVDVSDFNAWNGSKFLDTGKWSLGDFSADGASDVSDFNLWNANKFTSSAGVAVVPEPAGVFLVAWLAIVCGRRCRRSARLLLPVPK